MVEMIQVVRNLYLELLEDISQPFRKVEPNILVYFLKNGVKEL